MYVTAQRLDYPDHSEEIHTLNTALELIREAYKPLPFPANLQPAVDVLMKRLTSLMQKDKAVLSVYDQRNDRPCL